MTVGTFLHCGLNAGQKTVCAHLIRHSHNSSEGLVCSSHLESSFGVKPDFWGKLWSYMFCSLYDLLSAQNS